MFKRLKDILFAWAIVLDIIACTLWLSPLYLIKLADRPTGRQIISAYVGAAAINGMKWALIAEKIINALFFWDKDHCRQTYYKYGA